MKNKQLIWRDVELTMYEEKYFDYIYECYQEYDSRHLFTNDLTIQSKRELWNSFKRKTESVYHETMIAINVTTNIPIGFVYSYDYDMNNGHMCIAIYIQEKKRNSTTGAEVGAIFLKHLFGCYPIKKVYCTVYDYNKTSIKFLKGANFETEGLLKKHRYFNNEYHDMHIMSINRDGVYELLKRLKYKEYGKK